MIRPIPGTCTKETQCTSYSQPYPHSNTHPNTPFCIQPHINMIDVTFTYYILFQSLCVESKLKLTIVFNNCIALVQGLVPKHLYPPILF